MPKESQELNDQESKKQTRNKLIIKKADQGNQTKGIEFGAKEEQKKVDAKSEKSSTNEEIE